MTVYAHVLPGSQREAADRFAALIEEAGRRRIITKQSDAIADRALAVNEKLAAIKAQGLAASQAVAAIEGSLRHAARMPRFTAELGLRGPDRPIFG